MGEKEQSIISNFHFKYISIFKPGMLIRRMKKKMVPLIDFTVLWIRS